MQQALQQNRHVLTFLGATVVVCVLARAVLTATARPDVLAAAVTLDLTLFVPALYWVTMVRGRGWPPFSVLPVFLLSVVLAGQVVPADRQEMLGVVKWFAAPAELVLVWLLVRRVRTARRAAAANNEPDTLERLRVSCREAVGANRAADVLAFEVAVLWYALLSWRGALPAGGHTFHRRTAYGAIVGALLLAIAIEIVPVHALVARWSETLAWLVTALSIYGAVWVIGDARAVRLRATVIENGRLIVRFGLRWSLTVPLERIERATPVAGTLAYDRVDLRAALPGARRVAIVLDGAVEATGPYGVRRRVRTLELGVDEPERLLRELKRGTAMRG